MKQKSGSLILQEQRHVGEVLCQFFPELRKRELVLVKWIRTGGTARLRVVELVRRGNDELARRPQHAAHFGQQAAPVRQVFDHLEGDDKIERSFSIRQRRAASLREGDVPRLVL